MSASHVPRCRGLVLHDCHAEILAIRAFNYWVLRECHGILAEEQNSDLHTNTEAHSGASESLFIRRMDSDKPQGTPNPSIDWPPFQIQPDVRIYMYCTCAPCGDASMELCMTAQEDATPWEVKRQPKLNPETQEEDPFDEDSCLDGRAHFSRLGVVRRKPARTDAEPTRSKSCSDKLALRQVTSLLSCETSHLVAPTENAYLAGLVLPADEITRVGCDRCFGETGRMEALAGRSWPNNTGQNEGAVGYRFCPFQVLSVPSDEVRALWQFAKPKPMPAGAVQQSELEEGNSSLAAMPRKSKPGNVSAVWTAAPSSPHRCSIVSDAGTKSLPTLRRSKTGLYETLINGVKQGTKASPPSARGASSLSRARLWALLRDITGSEACDATSDAASTKRERTGTDVLDPYGVAQRRIQSVSIYEQLKQVGNHIADPLRIRREAMQDAKDVLKGWIPNSPDDDWGLDVLIDAKKRKR